VHARNVRVAEAGALQRAQQVGRHLAEFPECRHVVQLDDLGELLQEPRVDFREVVERLHRPSAPQRAEDRPHAAVVRHDEALAERRLVFTLFRRLFVERRKQAPELAELERPDRLQERFLERPPNRHRLAHRLHLRGQRPIRLRELLEVPPRELDDDVVDGGLEGGGREPGDVVGNLVEVIAERELGGDLGNREAGGLRGQRG
jgi:hypothetical protein